MPGGMMAPTGGWSKPYNGRTTMYVVLTCITAASGGLMFGYDVGISGTFDFRKLEIYSMHFFVQFQTVRESPIRHTGCI